MALHAGRPARFDTRLRVDISSRMATRLDELADEQEVPRAQLVRTAITRYLRELGGVR